MATDVLTRNATGLEPHTDETTEMIDVGGRRLALTSSGSGSPAVILETGLGAESDEWATVQRGVAHFTRVCRYDRAGRGSSDGAALPRCADDMVDDLRALLCKAQIPQPYVLVGHSFGGLLARRYASRHRGEVAGVVLVDSMHEDQFVEFGPRFPPEAPDDPEPFRRLRAFWTGGWRDPRSTQEGIDFPASLQQGREVETLGDLPIHIISAGTFLTIPGVPAHGRAELQRVWDALQERFTRLSSDAVRTVIAQSGHFVQRDRPEAVVAVVESIVAAQRRRARTDGP
jgi:pimeloyl-ACP methyl ester carboxylesterase